MGVESTLRTLVLRTGLHRWRVVASAYRLMSQLRYRNRWDQPVSFRGAQFVIGRDLSLYPAVRKGWFESEEIDVLLARVAPADTIWDVGGNVGLYSVLLARAAADGQVVAFEPVPASRERLLDNLERNAVTNVTVEPLALSDEDGSAWMQLNLDAHGCDRIVTGDVPTEARDGLKVVTVRGTTYAARSPLGDPGVIKVDIEGHEPEFIRGAWDVISRRRPTLMMEVNPSTWTAPGRYEVWDATLRQLFSLYGEGEWFEPSGVQRVSSVDVHALEPGLYTLIFAVA